jgi:long-chain alkane monooxygenase
VSNRPLLFAAFVSVTNEHGLYGAWRQPYARQTDFNSIDHWVDLVRLLERGKFDFIFFSDTMGLQGDFDGDWRKHAEAGVFFPVNDPSALVAALAYVTEHIGIAFTSSVIQEHPFSFARRMSTLDHLTRGRVAWNIVTTGQRNAAHNLGYQDVTPHDERYVWAEEYVDVTYKLWEGSWDEGALVQDRKSGLHADYERIHKINHLGKRYSVEGPHLASPSPQRTPFLFQAGASSAGREFAAKNAEAIFFTGANVSNATSLMANVRERAAKYGRKPEDIKFFLALHFIVGDTEARARERAAEIDAQMDHDAQLAHLGGAMGTDFGVYDPDTPIGEIETEGIRSIATWMRQSVQGRVPTVRDLATLISRDGRVVGTPEQIADELEVWRDAGIDGINVFNISRPGSYLEFIDQVMPVLQKRKLAKAEYAPGTIRRKLFGVDRLGARHPAAAYRGAFQG